jgi:hypothetical protein
MPSRLLGQFLIVPVLVAVEDRSALVRGPAAPRRRPGVGPVPVPGAVVPGRDEKRGESGASQFRSLPEITSAVTS